MDDQERQLQRQLIEKVNRIDKRLAVQEQTEQASGTFDASVLANTIHAATSKTTPVDADELPIADSAASYVLKKLTWANLKATLKTYFDTIYTFANIVADNAITNAKLRQSGALSVIGRSANSTGNVADISASAASGAVLRESGSTLGFGTITTAGITNNAVDNTKAAQMTANTVKSNITGSTANGADNDIATVLAQYIHAATSKTTPVGADELALIDSAASNVLKKLTITNLDTYLNTLYLVLAGQSGGQTANGDTAANGTLTLRPTSSGTKTTSAIYLADNGGKVSVGEASVGGGLFNVRNTPTGIYGFEVEADSGGRGWQVVNQDYVLSSAGAAVTFLLSAGSGSADASLNAYNTGKTASAALYLNDDKGGPVIIGMTSTGGNRLGLKAGTSTNDAAVGGVLYVDSGTHANTTSGETDLASYSVPANTLAVNNQSLRVKAWGTFAANGNTKTIKVKFGSTSVTLFALGTGGGGNWVIEAVIIRTGAATQDYEMHCINDVASPGTMSISTAAETLSGAVTLKLTGQGTSTNDIKQEGMKIWWDDANT
jgi:hypothetical protein